MSNKVTLSPEELQTLDAIVTYMKKKKDPVLYGFINSISQIANSQGKCPVDPGVCFDQQLSHLHVAHTPVTIAEAVNATGSIQMKADNIKKLINKISTSPDNKEGLSIDELSKFAD